MKLLGVSFADENSRAGKDFTATASEWGKKVRPARDYSVRRVRPGGNRRRWWQYCPFIVIGLLFICVAMPWTPSWVRAQSPPENVARQTKNVTIMTLEGQTINREITCEVDFTAKKWRMVFQRPLNPSLMTTQISVHETVLHTFPLHSAPEGWQTFQLSPELEQYFFSEGVVFTLGTGGAVPEYKFLLISRRLAKLVEYEVHPAFELEYKDAQGRFPVFAGDPIRVHYVFSRDLPAEANAQISFLNGEKIPLRLEGEGDFILRFTGAVDYIPPAESQNEAIIESQSEAMRLAFYFDIPKSVNTPEGVVEFDPYRDFPSVVGVAKMKPKMYVYPDAVRDDDVPPPAGFTSQIIVTTGNDPNTWFFSFPQADPKDMLVTTNQGKVMQARRLWELMAYHPNGQVPHYELYFGDVSKYSVLTVGILKVDAPRPFAGASIVIPAAMRDHYAEIGRKTRRTLPVLCRSSLAYNPPADDGVLKNLPPDVSIPMVPPPSAPPSNPNVPRIICQYRFTENPAPEFVRYQVTANEPIGFYVWLPAHIIQDINQRYQTEWHLRRSHVTRLISFPEGAWYRIFIDSLFNPYAPYNNIFPEDTDPGVVMVTLRSLGIVHPEIPESSWIPGSTPDDGINATTVVFGCQVLNQVNYRAEWNRPGGAPVCHRPTLSTLTPAPPYRAYAPAPYGRAPFLPLAMYITNAEAQLGTYPWNGGYINIGWHPQTHAEDHIRWPLVIATRVLWSPVAAYIELENGEPFLWVLDRDSGKIGFMALNNTSAGATEYAQIIGYHKSEMHPEDRRIIGLGCASEDIEVSANPTEVSGQEPVEITINLNGNGHFFYGVIEGGVEAVTFQSPGTYQVMVPEGSGELLLRVIFYGSTINCNPVIKEITIERGPVRPSKWRISAMADFPALKEPVPENGCYWEGPSYTAGIPVLKALSRTYQKLYGKNDICPLPEIPTRKGTSLFYEGMGTGVRQKDW